jgi:hypothetical protein
MSLTPVPENRERTKGSHLCRCGCGEFLTDQFICRRTWRQVPRELKHQLSSSPKESKHVAVRAILEFADNIRIARALRNRTQ